MAIKTPLDQGLIARVAAGIRLAVSCSLPDAWFGPGAPLTPVVSNPDEKGVTGRQMDYGTGVNTRPRPRSDEPVSFAQMRALADGYDLMRLVIETRKDQIAKMRWTVKPKDEKKNPDGRCTQAIELLLMPNREHDWDTWIRALLEDLFVIDAPTIYPRRTRGGQLYSLDLMDGATIKRLLDDTGRTPVAPDPAYQQILKGMPAVEYSRDELIYAPRNVRTNRVYGYSPVEQVITTVNIALRRQTHQLSYYTEGSTPDMIFRVPATWQPDQIAKFEEYWNLRLAGNLGARRGAMFVPDGVDPINTKEAILKDEYDEWLARIICYAFSVSHQAFVKQMNRSTADNAHQQALEEGLQPIMNWIKNLIDRVLVQCFGWPDLEFSWDEQEELDPAVQQQILDSRLRNGTKTINEVRAFYGDDPVPGGDVPLIYTAAGAIPLDRVLEPPPPPPSMNPMPDDSETGQGDDEPPPEGGNKVKPDKVAQKVEKSKKLLRPIDRDRKAVATKRETLRKALSTFLADQAQAIAAQLNAELAKVTKDAKPTTKTLEEILAGIKFTEWTDLVPDIEAVLSGVGEDGVKTAILQMGIGDVPDVMTLANAGAVDYAKARAAELVGKKWVDGALVDNPDAQWVITDSTREMVRGLVQQAMDEGWSTDELASAMQDSYAFSDERAEMIARTETANADVQGNLSAYRESGLVSSKQWLAAPDCCPDCQELNGITVPLDDDFPGGDPPLHPNCRCDVLPVLDEETQ